MVDIHCHILPALDDGAKDLETSLEMCRMAADDGIEAIVCTAHANDRYPFDPDLVERKIREVATQSGGVPHLYPGCDFHFSYENLQSALAADLMAQAFFELRSRGMPPIVTHPARNPWLLSAGRQLFDWVQAGALVQVTAGSLLGRFGKSAVHFCRWLLESRMIHFVASDAHNTTHRPPLLRDAYNEVAGRFGHDLAELIFKQYPRAALESEPISPEPPTLPSRKTFFDRMVDRFRR